MDASFQRAAVEPNQIDRVKTGRLQMKPPPIDAAL
jgi:hypothetical protein